MPGPYVPQLWFPDGLLARRRLARLTPRQPLVPVALATAGGIVLDRYASVGLVWLALLLPACVAWLVLWRRGRVHHAWCVLLASVALLAATWHHVNWRVYASDELGRFATDAATPVCLKAVALDTPARRSAPEPSPYRAIPGVESTRLPVRVTALRDGAHWRAVSGRSMLTVDGHLVGVAAGDRLLLVGMLARPTRAMNPGEFDYALDQRAQRRLSLLRCGSPDCVRIQPGGAGVSPRATLGRLRLWGEQTLVRRLGPRDGALAAAMVLGARDRLPRSTIERFRHAGALHVLVVSGLHVGLVISGFYFFARMGWAPRGVSLVIVMLAIAGYALLTGARPPVLRAAVLAELMCLAWWTGRRVLAMNSLAAAAIVVLAVNPNELFRTGAQLSFLAAATLIWYWRGQLDAGNAQDPMTRLLRSAEPPWRRLVRGLQQSAWQILAATCAVWLVALPLMLLQYNLLAPVAMPLAVLVFPLVSLSVTSALVVIGCEFALPWLAPAAGQASAAACRWLDHTIAIGDATAGVGYFYTPGPPLWWVLAFYLLFLAALRYGALPGVRRGLAYAVVLLTLCWVGPTAVAKLRPPSAAAPLRCTFIAVGHGVSVLLQPPGGGAVLYDAGSLGSPELATDRIAAVLWSQGITRLDAVLLSHPDVDHFGALPGLLDRFHVEMVVTTNQMFPRTLLPNERTAPAELLRLLNRRGVPVRKVAIGDQLRLGRARGEVIHPTPLGVVDTDNANSLVLGVNHAGRRILLAGDLEGRGLDQVLRQQPYDTDVLLAPHHGSPRSNPPGFAAWCEPEWVVISSAAGKHSPDTRRSYQQSGATVLSTASNGAVTFEITAEGVDVRAFAPGR